MPIAALHIEVDSAEVGFDAGRLARIDRHLATYVDDGRLPGWVVLVARRGRIAHLSAYGARDMASGAPVTHDTIWRMFSMTKPITTVAALMLAEEGRLALTDPVSRWIPAFEDLRVWRAGTARAPVTQPATEPLRIWHLMTHTSGLTYGFHYAHPVDAIYRDAGFEWGTPKGWDLAATCDAYAAMPLLFEPGAEWNYSVATDVLGRVVEVESGLSLDELFRQRITGPLGMTDTAFWVRPDDADRLATLYVADADRRAVPSPLSDLTLHRPTCLSGGGGLVGTAADYYRFMAMLRGGGELDGTRLLGSRTVASMTSNHLPGGADLERFGRPLFSETSYDGVGFGLGVSVTIDPIAGKVLGTAGEYGWGGAASTTFWIDPMEDLSVLFLTQLLPSSTHPLRPELRQLVYQALVD